MKERLRQFNDLIDTECNEETIRILIRNKTDRVCIKKLHRTKNSNFDAYFEISVTQNIGI